VSILASWLRLGIFGGLAIMIFSLLLSGEIYLFINPRFKWFIVLCIFLLILLCFVQLWNMDQPPLHRIGVGGYILIFFPLFIYLLLPPKALDASIATKKGVSYKSQQPTKKNEASNPNLPNAMTQTPEEADPLVPKLKKMDTIYLTEETYIKYFNTLSSFPKEFEGKEIQVKGFVYYDDQLPKHQFVTGRFTITCCAADATVIGFITDPSEDVQLKANDWIEIKGKLKTTKYRGMDMPMIEMESYQSISPPKDPYVYY
jgi:putative membrane protein